jgi:hypothetical protein
MYGYIAIGMSRYEANAKEYPVISEDFPYPQDGSSIVVSPRPALGKALDLFLTMQCDTTPG